jgi:hypothetical protein
MNGDKKGREYRERAWESIGACMKQALKVWAKRKDMAMWDMV